MRTAEPGRINAAFRGRLGNFTLHAELSLPATGVTAIFGPSGCGKTSVARCIAGLQRMADGFCAVDGEIWQDRRSFRPVHRRPIGYVFQEASLFPHLTVRGNLLFGAPKAAGAQIAFDEVVELLGLAALLDRSPHRLSGGERQRVAIGRALLSQPKLLLMDEPLAALDRTTKNEILPFLERLHEKLALPVLHISHDMAEIERFADHLVLMEHGRVIGAGPLHALRSDRHGDCPDRRNSVGNPTRMTSMPIDFHDIDPNRVAAILYRPQDDVDSLLADFAQDLVRSGERIGGVVQRNVKDGGGCQVGMQAIDLMTGAEISICQPLGRGAMACKLDAAGLAEAAVAVGRAITADVDLVVFNKFSKQEAAGKGLRDELAGAIAAGIPVLTAVPEKCLDAWTNFTGGIGTSLLCERDVIEGWWRDLSSRMKRAREPRLPSDAPAALLADHHVG
ncbi:molybdenum ABC transporter ATP-binding protein [Bradyrhizobium sp. cf659]|uniref:molybdenum ABC transporter ATP-binding protein n=1 Tax=Bradyrhizobium sp. cf659 TaxID=1761771 RepID=UPI0008E90E7E|nr:molybdenum ABC transporter ATP-binding protein [Bradyrhizobium sp. cf659]SFI18420.1 molybdenum ABC transporter, ATP-binding protein [Bradyrhizobium sp. cf659]